jgi:hypothetical protein
LLENKKKKEKSTTRARALAPVPAKKRRADKMPAMPDIFVSTSRFG